MTDHSKCPACQGSLIEQNRLNWCDADCVLANLKLTQDQLNFISSQKRLEVPVWMIVHKEMSAVRLVYAFDRDSAWDKFSTLYFGDLKPNPDEWIVEEANLQHLVFNILDFAHAALDGTVHQATLEWYETQVMALKGIK